MTTHGSGALDARYPEIEPQTIPDLIEATNQAQSIDDIHDVCQTICQITEFDFFIYGAVLPISLVRPEHVIISGYPQDWWERYQAEGYLTIDPVVAHTMSHQSVPLVWSDVDTNTYPHADLVRQFMREAQDFGLVSGVSFPAHGNRREHGILSLATRDSSPAVTRRVVEAMPIGQLLAGYIHEAVHRVLGAGAESATTPLTGKERECLVWAAEGKTAGEISDILGRAERTIVHHLQTASGKLDVTNRTQAVARAVALGYISPQFSESTNLRIFAPDKPNSRIFVKSYNRKTPSNPA